LLPIDQRGEPAAAVVVFGLDPMEYIGGYSLVLSRQAAISAADVLQFSRRLRI